MTYDELLINADFENLTVKEAPLYSKNGRIKGHRVTIRKDMALTEKKCVLAEELGHFYTTTGDILEQSSIEDVKQERRARVWAYNKLIGLTGIISAYKSGCRNRYEMAEHLEVSEEFLNEALECYRSKYGLYTKVDNYVVYFEPSLGVMELL